MCKQAGNGLVICLLETTWLLLALYYSHQTHGNYNITENSPHHFLIWISLQPDVVDLSYFTMNSAKEFCHKIKFSKPLLFQTCTISSNRIYILKYQSLGYRYKD